MVKRVLPSVIALAIAAAHQAAAQAPAPTISYTLSQQDVLIGANLVQAMSYNGAAITGAGTTFAVIDTGVAAPWIGFGPNTITPTPPSACLITPTCKQSLAVTDDNGHGTFVASEIVGSYAPAGFEGVAPGGAVVSVKVLNAQGSGTANDVASGILYAVSTGAKVLNLSLGPLTQSAPLVAAINIAASQGALIVFAGGNAGTAFNANKNITGLTDQAIKSMIFMGSTDAGKSLSSFSDTPGKGGFVSTTGVFYSYASRWMVADGENIWGASNYSTPQDGYAYVTMASGTSMTVPQASGSAGLLLQRWPYLTAPDLATILLTTAQRLGTDTVNNSYGAGFLNVYSAFTVPVGTLTVPAGATMQPLAAGSILSSGALGSMSTVQSALRHMVAYDAFMRDFPVGAGASVSSKAAAGGSTASAQVMGLSGPGSLSVTDLGNGGWIATSFSGTASIPVWASQQGRANPGLIQDPTQRPQNEWSTAIAQGGAYFGVGQGANAALSFNDARWGGKTAFFNSDAGVSGTLLSLASGGSFAAAGVDVGPRARFSLGVLTASDDSLANLTGTGASAHGAAVGYTMKLRPGVALSVTGAFLGETNMLLGSPSGGYLALGPAAETSSIGLGVNLDLGGGYQFGADSAFASTDPTHNAASVIGGTQRLTGAAFGIALRKDAWLTPRDSLGLAIRMPLRVYSGSADMSVPVGTDRAGNPILQQQRVSLVPTGHETDLELDYSRPLGNAASAGLSLTYRHDADNVAGATDGAVMARFKTSF